MNDDFTVANIIKRYMRLRNKSQKEIAGELNMNYKTLSGILNRNSISAELLLRLTSILDLDIDWMTEIIAGERDASLIDMHHATRMCSKKREIAQTKVMADCDLLLYECLGNIKQVKRKLIGIYHELFYLLDILIPEDVEIDVFLERGREIYYCRKGGNRTKGEEMLSYAIAARWEEIK